MQAESDDVPTWLANVVGVFNLTATEYTDNPHLTYVIGKVTGRPAILTIPSFVFRLFYGSGAEVMLRGQRAYPTKLLSAGFKFDHPKLRDALGEFSIL